MIGYFVSFLKNEFSGDEGRAEYCRNVLLAMMSNQILSTMSELFLELFNESMADRFGIITGKDFKYKIDELFELISEKIQRGGESFLEISFLFGGFICLAETDDKIVVEKEKMKSILLNLFFTLGINLQRNDVNNIINELASCDIHCRRESRDHLFSLLCGSQESHRKIFEIQNLFETNYYGQNHAFA